MGRLLSGTPKIIFISFLVCSVFIYGCESVRTYYVEKEKIPQDGVVRIAGVFLKSGGFVDLRNKNAKFTAPDKTIGIVYDGNNLKPVSIPADNISVLKIDVARNNYWVPVAIVGGAVIVMFIALILVLRFADWGDFRISG